MPELKYPEKFCVVELLISKNIKAGHAEKVAIREVGGKSYTFAQLQEQINRFANFVVKKGLKHRDRALIILPDSADFISTFFGCIATGMIPVVVNPLINKVEMECILRETGAAAIFTKLDFLPNLPQFDNKIIVDEVREELERSISKFAPRKMAAGDIAFIYYTSGTTGVNKGVAHKNICLAFCADTYSKDVARFTSNDIVYSSSKLSFIYALVNALYSPLWHGATVILNSERSNAAKAFEIIRDNKVTVFASVPAFYNAMLETNSTASLPSVRLCISAGEVLPPKIFASWKKRFGIDILDGIGTTETAGIFISNRIEKAASSCLGTLVDGYNVRIVDEELNDVEDGKIGYLIVNGVSLAAEYWNNPHLTQKMIFEIDGQRWFKTGDMIRKEEGNYLFCGRADDVIKQSGIPVSSTEIEIALGEHPSIVEVAVTKSTEGDGLEKAKAFVVLKNGALANEGTKKELKEFIKVRLAPYKRPKIIEFVEALPRTSVGKIYRKKLRETKS